MLQNINSDIPQKKQKSNSVKFLILIAAAIIIVYLIDPTENTLIPCVFKSVTGYKCPGCGLMRGSYHLMHLHLYEAVQYNLLIILIAPLLLFLVIKNIMVLYNKRIEIPFNKRIMILIGFIMMTFWITRNIYNF